ncbi:conserved hypothetical protein [Leadbettera azotonutricia ZAS-9]|uniref:Uncharacterized protein n=1 Tax=Leadbettera azotonutricia (strain ATCC BAA-888 / DSM 13862 / ZAS-9) TaxID=545695 RepID=F5Y6R2_LEAAZ|nr:conserved hypothetical protein [Leadbettera azotonutricia ZAS-9]
MILNRGGRYARFSFFEELEKAGFDYVVSLEGPQKRYDLEGLSGAFPFVRFILLQAPISTGEAINLAASELSSPLFFVLWNDLRILRGGGASRMAERLLFSSEELARNPDEKNTYRRLCTVPVIQDNRFETVPTLIAPVLIRGSVKTVSSAPAKEGSHSLYPFDGVGIYDRERFIRLGGFDGTLKSFHWQLMDLGFRSRLWGEEIASTQAIKLSYEGAMPAADSTAEESYRRFYLKNLAPVFRGDYANLPLRRFPGYVRRSGGGIFSCWDDFKEARGWVKTNRFRFRCDARTMANSWAELFGPTETGGES